MKRQQSFILLSKRQKDRRIAQRVNEDLLSQASAPNNAGNVSFPSANDFINGSSTENTPTCSERGEHSNHFVDLLESSSSEGYLEAALEEAPDPQSDSAADSDNSLPPVENRPVETQLKKDLRNWSLEFNMPHNATNSLLQILRSAGHCDLPKDTRTLLGTPKTTDVKQLSWGQYIHYGLEKAVTDQLKHVAKSNRPTELSFDIHLDGVAISKSSKLQLWTIMGKIYSPDFETPFFIGAHASYGKPKSVSEYLKDFSEEYSRLAADGFVFEEDRYSITIRAVIADTPARTFATSTKSHNGFYGCGKCFVRGTRIASRTVFLEADCQLRTDANFKDRTQIQHHLDKSPLEELGLGMVTQFPLDYMHLVCLGVVKKLLNLWIEKKIITRDNLKILSDNLVAVREYIPQEFARKCRALDDLDRWKATELRLFLYVGLALLKDILPQAYYRHFAALSCAIMILADPEECIRNNDYANSLLRYFVQTMPALYGNESVVYNMHSLIHIAADVKGFGPLDDFSAFPYENSFISLKKLLRKCDNPLAQLYNRISELSNNREPRVLEACNYPRLMKPLTAKLPMNCHSPHHSIRFQSFTIRSTENDNCCLLSDGTIIIVEHIGYRGDEQIVIGRKFNSLAAIPDYPCDSTTLEIFMVCKLSRVRQVWPVLSIQRKMIRMPLSDTQSYVLPLVHTSSTHSFE